MNCVECNKELDLPYYWSDNTCRCNVCHAKKLKSLDAQIENRDLNESNQPIESNQLTKKCNRKFNIYKDGNNKQKTLPK